MIKYEHIDAVNISTLKELWSASPKHYRHLLRTPRADTPSMLLGRAIHCAVLEPECFAERYIVVPPLDKRTKAYKQWAENLDADDTRELISTSQHEICISICDAVRYDNVASPLLDDGAAEQALVWADAETGVRCKGRIDWITENTIVGLKTTARMRHGLFRQQAASLGYHLQWAFYNDGWMALNGAEPSMIEIVVETTPPHDVVVYHIPPEVLDEGRRCYAAALQALLVCRETDRWPGIGGGVENVFSLPKWAVHEDDDLGELGLDLELGEQA